MYSNIQAVSGIVVTSKTIMRYNCVNDNLETTYNHKLLLNLNLTDKSLGNLCNFINTNVFVDIMSQYNSALIDFNGVINVEIDP